MYLFTGPAGPQGKVQLVSGVQIKKYGLEEVLIFFSKRKMNSTIVLCIALHRDG